MNLDSQRSNIVLSMSHPEVIQSKELMMLIPQVTSRPIGSLRHLAIIMDGNGRWAERNQRPRSEGHQKGAETVKRVVRSVHERGIPHLTLFAFSSLNWGRPTPEIKALMELLTIFLRDEVEELIARGIRLNILGERDFLPMNLQTQLADSEVKTAAGTQMTLNIAVSYDGRRDVVNAAKALVGLAQKGELHSADVSEPLLMSALSTGNLPEVDLLIRTSGERRLSGFLPLEACYAELVFIDQLWPDFTVDHLIIALDEYEHRQRRFGKTSQQIALSSSPA